MRISDWSSDVCSSDLGEGWHLPPAEAMACGCAVVSTDIPGVFDYALEGTTALLAPPGDSATLADRLTELLDDDVQLPLASRGHQHIQRFSVEESAGRLEQILGEEIGARR